ncbi:MAG: hypothetical protein HOQ05_02400, partial [Corynebacteriales bacterium]|nr:hypothetical protein [Mycobacteriales bacterium]
KAEHLPNIDDHRVRYFSRTDQNPADIQALAMRLGQQLRESLDDPDVPTAQRLSDRTAAQWVEGATLALNKVRTSSDVEEETARAFLQAFLDNIGFADRQEEFDFLERLTQPRQFQRFLPGMQKALIRELIESPIVGEEDRNSALEDLAGIEKSRPASGDDVVRVTLRPWVANIRNNRIILAANLVSVEHESHPFGGAEPPMIHAATVRDGSKARRVLSHIRRTSREDATLSEFALVGKNALPEDVAAFAGRISQLGGNSYVAGGERTLELVGKFHDPAHRTTFVPSKLDLAYSIDMTGNRQTPTRPSSPTAVFRKLFNRN